MVELQYIIIGLVFILTCRYIYNREKESQDFGNFIMYKATEGVCRDLIKSGVSIGKPVYKSKSRIYEGEMSLTK